MRRREFLAALGAAAGAWPLAAPAQQGERVPTIGYLSLVTISPGAPWPNEAAFQAGLRDLGHTEGKNLRIEYRSTHGDESRLDELATELVRLNVDVIVTAGSGVYAAHRATTTIPIVMTGAGDVVAMGVVNSLAHPGGNITGLTSFAPELMAKRLELLKQIWPSLTRAGILLFRGDPSNSKMLDLMQAPAETLKVELFPIEVGSWDLDSAFSALSEARVGGFVVGDAPQLMNNVMINGVVIANLASRARLPSIGPPELAEWGGLMGYGVNFVELYRRAAVFVDKILKGVSPGDIPIEQPTKFKSIVNLKTAKALGLDIPPTLLAAATEVIE